MKETYFLAGLLALYLPAAMAVEFNTDALKSMQEEGEKQLQEEKSMRTFRLSTGLCLHAAGEPGKPGANLTVDKCDGKSNRQKWRLDDEGRLASQAGTCVGVAGEAKKPGSNAVLQNCGSAKAQQWKLDGKGRLVNGLGRCLEASGDGKKAGGNVVSAECKESPTQVWK